MDRRKGEIFMNGGLVSVLVPVYNGEEYLHEMLMSIAEQTYRPIQIIIGNDCSTDLSETICYGWTQEAEKDAGITVKYINNKSNLGLAGNLSSMARYVEGEFVFLADQDDVWHKDKIRKQVEYMLEHEKCVICLCDRSITDKNLNVVIPSAFQNAGYKIKSMSFDEVTEHLYGYSSNCMAIRNNGNIKEIMQIPQGVIMHDTFIAVMASYFGTVDYLFESLVYYRIHENNLSGNYSSEFSKNFFEALIKNCSKARRVQMSIENDERLIRDELKKRYLIEITNKKSPYVTGRKRDKRLVWAMKQTMLEYKQGIVGCWKNYSI